MIYLDNDFAEVSDFAVSDNHLITSSKHGIRLYEGSTLTLLGELSFGRFPKIIRVGKKSFLLQDQNSLLEIDYALHQRKLFDLDFKDVWMVYYLNEYDALMKQSVDSTNTHFRIIRYDGKKGSIVWESKCDSYKQWFINSDHIIVDFNNSSRLQKLDSHSGVVDWTFDINSKFESLYPLDKGECEVASKPLFYKDTLIVHVQKLDSARRYLCGLNIHTGEMQWHSSGYSNFQLHSGLLYNIEFHGLYRILNPQTGKVERQADLKNEFERMDINCEHSFNVTDSYIYFKHAIRGKFGILNMETLQIEEAQQLPEGNTMSTEEYPIPVADRVYVRSAPQNCLFVYLRS